MIIFYDQDDILNLISKAAILQYNIDFNENYDWKQNSLYWWADVPRFNKQYFVDLLNTKGFFYNIEPQEEGLYYMKKLIDEGNDVRVLTHPQWNNFCTGEKIDWFKKYAPFFDITKLGLMKDKWLMAGPDRILYDDNTGNLKEWKNYGGISIALDYKFNKDWNGLRVKSHKEFYELIQQLKQKSD